MQVLFFMPFGLSLLHGNAEQAERTIRHYAYTDVVTVFAGRYEGRNGVYFVLEGEEHRIDSTEARLASGLHFTHKVTVLA